MMHQPARVLRLDIRETDTGMFVATSADEPTFYIAESSEAALWEAIPCILEWLYRDSKQSEVVVFTAEREETEDEPYVAIVPKELVARRALEAC